MVAVFSHNSSIALVISTAGDKGSFVVDLDKVPTSSIELQENTRM